MTYNLPAAITKEEVTNWQQEIENRYLIACINHINEALKRSGEPTITILHSSLSRVAEQDLFGIERVRTTLIEHYRSAGWTVTYDDTAKVSALAFS